MRNLALKITTDEKDPLLDCLDGKQEQFDALQQMDPWARNAPKFAPDVKDCLSVKFLACSPCQKLGWECTNECQLKRPRVCNIFRFLGLKDRATGQ